MTSTTAGDTQSYHLKRDIGLLGLTFVSLGSIIGSGWLLGALNGAEAAGPASLISWIIGGTMLASLALVHAELGAAYPVAGGTARFPNFAFGTLTGFTAEVGEDEVLLLADAQTSGGLRVVGEVPGYPVIGGTTARGPHAITVRG